MAAIQATVTKQQQETEDDLAKAEPALQAANAALNTLNRVNQLCTHKYRDLDPVATIDLFYLFYFTSFNLFYMNAGGANIRERKNMLQAWLYPSQPK